MCKGCAKRTTDNLVFAQEVAEALELKRGELARIAGVMLGYRQQQARMAPTALKDSKRKR
jgi:hypothetical protein